MPAYNVHELEVNTVLVPTLYYTLFWLVPTLCCTLYWYQPYTIQYMHCWLVPTLYCNLYRYQPCTIKYCNGWYQPCIVLYIVLLPTLYYTVYTLYWLVPTLYCTVHCTGTDLAVNSVPCFYLFLGVLNMWDSLTTKTKM